MLSRFILVAGGLLLLVGLVMIPLSGPGYLLVSLGLQVVAAGLVVAALSRFRERP